MIETKIVAHSKNHHGDELITVLATFPRMILAEVNTHRMLSKNTSSSRAIPFKKMVESIKENPFIPIAFQEAHSGMQGMKYIEDDTSIKVAENSWLIARDEAVEMATYLNDQNVTKQLCNRLLEPFMWTTMLITGSREGWENFFRLRCPQYDLSEIQIGNYKGMTCNPLCRSWKEVITRTNLDMFDIGPSKGDYAKLNKLLQYSTIDKLKINKGGAEIHIMDLAEKIYDGLNQSTPKLLEPGQWHIPFRENIPFVGNLTKFVNTDNLYWKDYEEQNKVKISVAMAARTSYTMVGGETKVDYEKLIGLHDRLLQQDPPHSSPFEHTARCMSDDEYDSFIRGRIKTLNEERDFNENIEIEEPLFKDKGWCYNLKGFMSYRYIVDNSLPL